MSGRQLSTTRISPRGSAMAIGATGHMTSSMEITFDGVK
jgi:hypothetical protein